MRVPASRYGDVLACLAVAVLGYFTLFVAPEEAANLVIVPDEGQYAVGAYNLFTRGVYAVTLNHQDHPALYPYGFSLLLVPALYLWGPFVGNVTYANFVLNEAAAVLTYVAGRMVGGPLVGCLAALFLLGNHVFLLFAHRIVSQGAVALGVVVAAVVLLRVQDRRDGTLPLGLLAGLGVAVGYLPALHVSGLPVDVAVLIALGLVYAGRRRKAVAASLVVVGVSSILVAAQLEYNRRTFGGFFQSGYAYWYQLPVSSHFPVRRLLSLDFTLLPEALARRDFSRLGQFLKSNNFVYYFSGLLGLHKSSVLYSPAAAILIVLGGRELLSGRWGARGRLFVLLAAATLLGFLGLFVPYQFLTFRYLLPALPLLGVVAAVGLTSTVRRGLAGPGSKAIKTGTLALAVLVLADLSYTYVRGGVMREALQYAEGNPAFRAKYACAQLYRSLVEADAVIVSALDINYVSHFITTGPRQMYLPLARGIRYIARDPRSPNDHWRDLGYPAIAERPRALSALLDRGVPVYSDDLREREFPDEYGLLRSLFEWKIVGTCSAFHIYRIRARLPETVHSGGSG